MELKLDKRAIEDLIINYKEEQGIILDEVELNYEALVDANNYRFITVYAILKRKIELLDKIYKAQDVIGEHEIRYILHMHLQRKGEFVKGLEFQVTPGDARDPMEIEAIFDIKNKVRGREMVNNEQNNNTK